MKKHTPNFALSWVSIGALCLAANTAAMAADTDSPAIDPLFADTPKVEKQPKPVSTAAELMFVSNKVEIALDKTADAPVFVTFDKSPSTAAALKQHLSAAGIAVTEDRAAAKTELRLSGRLTLFKGPLYQKRLIRNLGELMETVADKEVALVDKGTALDVAALQRDAKSSAFGSAMLGVTTQAAIKDLGLGAISSVLTSKIAEAATGDPRGFCIPIINNCADWNKVEQKAILKVEVWRNQKVERIFKGYAYAFQDDLVVGILVQRSLSEVFGRFASPVAPVAPENASVNSNTPAIATGTEAAAAAVTPPPTR